MRSRWIIFTSVVFGAALLAGTAIAQQGPTALGLRAWGERLQAEARVYQRLQQQQDAPTALALRAWGERLQAEARIYQQLRPDTVRSPATRFDWGDAGIGGLLGFALAAVCAGAVLARHRFGWPLGRPDPPALAGSLQRGES